MSTPKETKLCATCGRPFTNRKRWKSRNQWEVVKYCSANCRRAAGKQLVSGDSQAFIL